MQSREIRWNSDMWHFQFDWSAHLERYILLKTHLNWSSGSKIMSRILRTIEKNRNSFLFLVISHNQCSWLPTDSARSQHMCPSSTKEPGCRQHFPDNFFINFAKMRKEMWNPSSFQWGFFHPYKQLGCFQHWIETYLQRKCHISITNSQIPGSFALQSHIGYAEINLRLSTWKLFSLLM